MVWVSADVQDPTGGHLFRQFAIQPDGVVMAVPPPLRASRRRPPPLAGIGAFERTAVHELPNVAGRGRYGWKARYSTLEMAIAGALAGEMGLTTSHFSTDGDSRRPTTPRVAEVSPAQLEALVAFVRSLEPPPPTRFDAAALVGQEVFEAIGCGRCHDARTVTVRGDGGSISACTDLKVHSLGPSLSDGIKEVD